MKSITAIDFGSSKIVTLVADTGGTQRCDIVGAGTAPYDGFVEREWNNPEGLEDAIRASVEAAAQQANRLVRNVYVGVPGDFLQICTTEPTVTIQGADPRVTKDHIDQLFKEAARAFHPEYSDMLYQSPAWFMVDNGKKTLEPVGQKGGEIKALISTVYAYKSFTDTIKERMENLGYHVENFYPSNVGQALLYLPEEARDRTAVLIDMGYLCTDVMIVEGDAVIFEETLSEGGGHIALEIADKLGIQFESAEQIKREFLFDLTSRDEDSGLPPKTYDITESLNEGESARTRSFTQGEIAGIIEPFVQEMGQHISECIDNSGIKLGQWSNVYLTGGGLCINRGGRDFLSVQLNRPMRELPKRSYRLTSQIYTSAMGLMDLCIDMDNTNNAPSKLSEFFKSLLGN